MKKSCLTTEKFLKNVFHHGDKMISRVFRITKCLCTGVLSKKEQQSACKPRNYHVNEINRSFLFYSSNEKKNLFTEVLY